MDKRKITRLSAANTYAFLMAVFGPSVHAKRVLSIANATTGVLHAASLAVSVVGRALAQAEGKNPKHAIKQVDNLLSNSGVDVWSLFAFWVPYIVGARPEVVVALDWTEFDSDDQSTLAIHLVTRHGRATPLLWKTVTKSSLKGWRNAHEDSLLIRLKEVIPANVKVTVLADRGFGDVKLYALLWELDFDFVIRFRGDVTVTNAAGEARAARDWLRGTGSASLLKNPTVTLEKVPVPAVVTVHDKKMKDAWHLATSHQGKTAKQIVGLYGRRFSIEESFRDTKDMRFGMGLSSARITKPHRRDRMLLLNAVAIVLLTLLGAAGEEIGLDRMLRANTVKRRTHSLFFQGCYYYGALPNMRQSQFEPLMLAYERLLREHSILSEVFGLI